MTSTQCPNGLFHKVVSDFGGIPWCKTCGWRQTDGTRDGRTYDHRQDFERLNGQMKAVAEVLFDQQWHTVEEVKERTGHSRDAALTARIRDFRKAKYGGHEVESRRVSGGLWEYRLTLRREQVTA